MRQESSLRDKMNTIHIAKSMMKLFEYHPQFSESELGELNEVFNHEYFIHADESTRNAMMLQSSESKYNAKFSILGTIISALIFISFLKGRPPWILVVLPVGKL